MIFLASNYLTSLQTFFLTLSRLQTIYFVFSDPANNFFQYFSIPPPASQKKKKKMVCPWTNHQTSFVSYMKLFYSGVIDHCTKFENPVPSISPSFSLRKQISECCIVFTLEFTNRNCDQFETSLVLESYQKRDQAESKSLKTYFWCTSNTRNLNLDFYWSKFFWLPLNRSRQTKGAVGEFISLSQFLSVPSPTPTVGTGGRAMGIGTLTS